MKTKEKIDYCWVSDWILKTTDFLPEQNQRSGAQFLPKRSRYPFNITIKCQAGLKKCQQKVVNAKDQSQNSYIISHRGSECNPGLTQFQILKILISQQNCTGGYLRHSQNMGLTFICWTTPRLACVGNHILTFIFFLVICINEYTLLSLP